MRKYIIVPVFLAVVLVMMCHCTSDRKATVPANEYLIQGELANLSDSIVIGLYVDEGNIFNLVARDTLLNGKFSFRDTVSVTKKMLIMSDNKGFPGTWLEVWIAPGEYIEIKGEDKLLKTWEVVSDIPEQAEENRFTACAMAQQKELMQHLAAEYDWQRMMFIDHAGDQEFEKKGWAKIDSIRKLTTPLQQEIWKKELEYMKEAPIVTVRMVNYKISVIGEVTRPGTFTISNEKVNLLEALAMAGDMTVYGLRDNVKLIREDATGKQEIITLDLNKSETILSPYYWLQQNDVVYVTPNKAKARNSDIGNSTSLWFSATSILVSLASLLFNILK